jgi:hypothetical protein
MSIAAARRLAVSVGVAVAVALAASGATRAQDFGFVGIPEHTSTESGIPYFNEVNARAVDQAYAGMQAAIARCDMTAYFVALNGIAAASERMMSALGTPQNIRDVQLLREAAIRRPLFPSPCPPVVAAAPGSLRTTAERLHAQTTMPSAPLSVAEQAGLPGVTVRGTPFAVYDTRTAERASRIIADARRAAAACDAAALERAMNEYSALISDAGAGKPGETSDQLAQRRNSVDILGRLYQLEFPKQVDCPRPAGQATTPTPGTTPAPGMPPATTPAPGATPVPGMPAPPADRRTGMLPGGPMFELAAVFTGFHPAMGGLNVTGFDLLAGAAAKDFLLANTTPYHALGLAGRFYCYDLFGQGGPLPGAGVFAELGADFFLNRSHYQTFQRVNGFPQGFGEHVLVNNWAVNVALGIAIPIGTSPFMGGVFVGAAQDGGQPDACTGGACAVSRNVMLDLYVGAAISNRTHTLQGNEAGAGAGAIAFYAQTNRTTIDPRIGVGVRLPFAVGGGPAMFAGLNSEVTWRPGSVVAAQSRNFPSQAYYGTVDPGVDFSVSARLGISF